MAYILSVAQAKDHLNIPASNGAEDVFIGRLITQLEAYFLRRVGRKDRPFAAAATGRVEQKDGTGSRDLWLDYPIAALATNITTGHNPSVPTETIAPTDYQKVIWRVGGRRIARVDGGVWGCRGEPLWITVTYDTQAEKPADVQMAMLRVLSACWRETARGQARAERKSDEIIDLPLVADRDPIWQQVIDDHWEPNV